MKFLLLNLAFLLLSKQVYTQETGSSGTAVKASFGIGINSGKKETGNGLIYSIGWQKSLGKEHKIRINPNMMFGEFSPFAITDVRKQFYRITNLGFNLYYDLIRYRAVSLVVTAGGFMNYSRGLLGTGGPPELNHNRSEYFHHLYFGVNGSAGIRINSKKSRLAYEIRPVNIYYGTNEFILGYMMIGVDIKLKK